MDQNVSRIVSGTGYGARPTPKKRPRQEGRGQPAFAMGHKDAAPAAPPDAAPEHEPLPVSKPTEEEAGGHLDLTA